MKVLLLKMLHRSMHRSGLSRTSSLLLIGGCCRLIKNPKYANLFWLRILGSIVILVNLILPVEQIPVSFKSKKSHWLFSFLFAIFGVNTIAI